MSHVSRTARTGIAVWLLSALPVLYSHAGTSTEAQVARGQYLVNVSGCNDCHTPKVYTPDGMPVPDERRLLSGHPQDAALPHHEASWSAPGQWVMSNEHFTAWVGPWGTSYAANLTPDKQTGIGLWTKDVFVEALRTGRHAGRGRPILPPMPWPNLAKASDDDLAAIYAYLMSLPPIHNAVPAPVPPTTQAGVH